MKKILVMSVLVLELLLVSCTSSPGVPNGGNASDTWKLQYAPSYFLKYDPSKWFVGSIGVASTGLINIGNKSCIIYEPGEISVPADSPTEVIGATTYTVVNELNSTDNPGMVYIAYSKTDAINHNYPAFGVAVPSSDPTTCLNEAKVVLSTLP